MPGEFSKRARLLILATLTAAGVTLTYLEIRGLFSESLQILVPCAYLGLIAFLVGTGVIQLPKETGTSWPARRINILDVARALAFMLGGILWAMISAMFVSDTTTGALIVFAPCVCLIGAGGYIMSRSFVSGEPR